MNASCLIDLREAFEHGFGGGAVPTNAERWNS
jgi:hypothetical protein